MNNEIKKVLNSMLENTIDEFMCEYNFKRRKNSLIYSRNFGTAKQKIEMVYFLHPSYHPEALAHIYPWLYVSYPEVNKIAYEMFKDANLQVASMKETIRQPLQINVNTERWMIINKNDCVHLSESIKFFLQEYTIFLLNSLKSIEDYIALYELKDSRLIMDDAFYIFIVSAYILKGAYEQAQNVLERRFGKSGARERYASAFEYLENLMKDIKD